MAIAVEDIPRALVDAARRSRPSLSLPHERYVELFGGELVTRLVMPPAAEVGELSDEQASALVRSPYLRGDGASTALRQLVAGLPEPGTARVSIRMSRSARALFDLKAALLDPTPCFFRQLARKVSAFEGVGGERHMLGPAGYASYDSPAPSSR